jgi:Primase C terminal 2 (PriCT-2)
VTASLEPDTRAMLHHLLWLTVPARSVAPGLRIEISWGNPDAGPNLSRTYNMGELDRAAQFAAWINRKGCNLYIGVTLKSADAPLKGRTAADKAALATCVPVDSDTQFVATADKLAMIAKPELVVMTGRYPESRGQFFIRIEPTTDLTAWENLHERIVQNCGGDENALGKSRLMRLAGSVSYPSPKKIKRGYLVERTSAHFVPAPEYSVPGLLAICPVPQTRQLPPAVPTIIAGCGARRAKRPLPAVEAALRNLPEAYAVEQRLWIKVGFALFDFDQGPSGMALWKRFSQRCPEKAGQTDFPKIWASFGRPYSGRRISIAWLLREAKQPSVGA